MEKADVEGIMRVYANRLKNTKSEFQRYLYNQIDWDDRLIGIKGSKGVGKTTMILQHIKDTFPNRDKALYVSLDNLWFSSHDLIDLVDYHYTHGGTTIFIDEVHYYPQWQVILKNLYDDYPDLHIVYSGSSMLHIDTAQADLSRRQMVYELSGMSFREYLAYEGVLKVQPISLEDILLRHQQIAEEICSQTKILTHFANYLQHGYYPFYKEVRNGYDYRLQQVVGQILEIDYPSVEQVTISTVRKARKMLTLLSEQVPYTPNMNDLYRELETDRNQGLKILSALERGRLIATLHDNTKSVKAMSRPEKIFLDNSNLMYALSPRTDIGNVRETFFFNQLSQTHEVCYPKQGDFLVDKQYLFEVGGKSKTFAQIKDEPNSFLAVDDTEIGHHNRIPLWLFGLMY